MEAAVKIKDRQQFLIVLTLAAVALFVGVNFILTPLTGWWEGRATQIKDLRAKVKNGQSLVRREAYIRGDWDNMRTNALPANTSLAEHQLLNAVDDWSRRSGVEILVGLAMGAPGRSVPQGRGLVEHQIPAHPQCGHDAQPEQDGVSGGN